ncbi:methyltransferase domain-containing protein [Litoribacter alkaliphilus]|uniref:Methyltransferase domain-containing protein n=1 Tax=Litoribacter ruber TaxID=702568 RepID=A0AAP2G6E8_9BACT|nr:class I SAM-dependent methyltransferase [Litoribacter alkaliphilus]MBS9525623.1 methyltransferase domain-containing protein [Litoribacter alkaliphilus]
METTAQFDPAKAEQFAGNLADAFNKASLTMMISLGHRSGLFDSLAENHPSTSSQIAQAANLHERYVREWLGAMVAGGVIEFETTNGTYRLPAEHAAFLTRKAGPENYAVFAEFIFSLAANGDQVLDCMKNGGGISYDAYHRFYHAMDEDQSIIGTFFQQLLPSIPDLTAKLHQGISVLDAGCGTGGLLLRLASEFTNSHFTGIDLTEFAINMARSQAEKSGLANVEFICKDLTEFHSEAIENRYDLVMSIDAIHDQKSPMNVLRGIYKTLKPDGTYLMVDINGSGHLHQDKDNPFAQLLYAISCMHCVPVSLGQGGEGLGAMWGETRIRDYTREAGFSSITPYQFQSDPLNTYFIIGK